MTSRKFTMVCKDCGEVCHLDLALLKNGAMVACVSCGLLANPAHLHLPAPAGLPGIGNRGPPAAEVARRPPNAKARAPR